MTEELNLGPITRNEGFKKMKEHSSVTSWFEQWNEKTRKIDFCLIWNPDKLTNFEI